MKTYGAKQVIRQDADTRTYTALKGRMPGEGGIPTAVPGGAVGASAGVVDWAMIVALDMPTRLKYHSRPYP